MLRRRPRDRNDDPAALEADAPANTIAAPTSTRAPSANPVTGSEPSPAGTGVVDVVAPPRALVVDAAVEPVVVGGAVVEVVEPGVVVDVVDVVGGCRRSVQDPEW